MRGLCFSAKLSQEIQLLHFGKTLARDLASAFLQSSRKRFSVCISSKLSQEIQRLHFVKALTRDSASAFRQSSRKRFSVCISSKLSQEIRLLHFVKALARDSASCQPHNCFCSIYFQSSRNSGLTFSYLILSYIILDIEHLVQHLRTSY